MNGLIERYNDNILSRARKIAADTKRPGRYTEKKNGLEERDITQVSGGQLPRAGICRAIMNNPAIIFADVALLIQNQRRMS
jgi:putative ABC transport system ATP-binding protein